MLVSSHSCGQYEVAGMMHDMFASNHAKQRKAMQSNANQRKKNKAMQSKAKQHKPEQSNAEQSNCKKMHNIAKQYQAK